MKHLLLLLFLLLLTSCFNQETRVKLKSDGTGTLLSTVYFSESVMQMLSALDEESESGDKMDFQASIVEEASHSGKQFAQNAGENLSFSSAKSLSDENGTGYQLTFTFQNIGELVVPLSAMDSTFNPETTTDVVRFSSPKSSKVKVILNDEKTNKSNSSVKEESETPKDTTSEADKETQREMMKSMFKGLRFTMLIEIEDKDFKTTATHVEKNIITVFDINYDAMVESPETFDILADSKSFLGDNIKSLNKIPGIKVEPQNSFTIKF